MKKWLKRIALGLLAFVALALGVIWIGSELRIRQDFEVRTASIHIPTDAASIEEGERLAQVFGCYRGCHGRHMEGERELFDLPDGTRIRSPNLTRLVQEQTPEQLEASIRQGVKPNGRSVLAMPSGSFATMSDTQLGQILAFIRQYPEQDNEPGKTRLMPMARFFLLVEEFDPNAVEATAHYAPTDDASLSDPDALGAYLAMNACSECHGMDLNGQGDFTPSLLAARAYDLEGFRQLMREGEALGGRDIGLMGRMSLRFSRLTDDEIGALHAWLQTADIPRPAPADA